VENPSIALRAIASSLSRLHTETVPSGIAALEAVVARAKSTSDRTELETLAAEARRVAPIRDERALLTDLTACGIIHHLLLECGRRVDADKHQLVLFASLEEIQALLRGTRQVCCIVPSFTFFTEYFGIETILPHRSWRVPLKEGTT
jgi:hypothetical protein